MGMVIEYARLRPDETLTVRRLLDADPEQAFEYIEQLGIWMADDDAGATPRGLDLDKAWDGIRYLLDRAGPPPVDIIGGGDVISNEPWGYDAPRLLSPAEVAAAARFLQATPFDRLAAHFDPEKLTAAGVYPDIWEHDDALEYLAGWYQPLVEFVIAAADQGDGMLVRLT